MSPFVLCLMFLSNIVGYHCTEPFLFEDQTPSFSTTNCSFSLDAVASLIKDGRAKKIVVMVRFQAQLKMVEVMINISTIDWRRY